MKTLRLRRLAVAAAVGSSALLGVPGTASADVTDVDVQAIVDALVAAGVPEELIDADVQARLAEHIEELVDADVVEPEDIDELREDLDATGDAGLEDAVDDRIKRGRQRQADYRDAVRAALAERGIELEDGQSAREALRAEGYSDDEVRDLLPKRREVRCDVEDDCDKGRKHRDHEDDNDEKDNDDEENGDEREERKDRGRKDRVRKHRDRTHDDDPITEPGEDDEPITEAVEDDEPPVEDDEPQVDDDEPVDEPVDEEGDHRDL